MLIVFVKLVSSLSNVHYFPNFHFACSVGKQLVYIPDAAVVYRLGCLVLAIIPVISYLSHGWSTRRSSRHIITHYVIITLIIPPYQTNVSALRCRDKNVKLYYLKNFNVSRLLRE